MKRKERMRDTFQAPPSPEYWSNKANEGWKLVAAEWEKDAEPAASESPWVEEIPYGMKVGPDCLHLVENPEEKDALILMLEMIVADKSFSEVAECVNARGFHTRAGAEWTQIDIFDLMPRLVEVASRIYPTHDWSERRRGIFKLVRQR
jgi:hypothetical protein